LAFGFAQAEQAWGINRQFCTAAIDALSDRLWYEGRDMSCAHGDPEDGDLIGEDGKIAVPPQVADAIRTLIAWAGDDPTREGLVDTPKRVARAWREYCAGYGDDPAVHLSRVFEEVGGYDEIVLLKDIPFQSHCEHHMAPIIGRAHIAYLPRNHVVGISKLARVLHGFARRLQVQERLTAEVADCIWQNLKPLGVAVVIEATHACMTARGVRTPGVAMVTSRMMGVFRDDDRSRKEVLSLMGLGG
jgi:GTP cyclohydrolase I